MQKMLKAIDKVSGWGGIGASLCILIIVAIILIEIFVRTLSGSSTFITEEYSGYLLCWFAFLGMAETLRTDGHIRVNILLSRLSPRKRTILEMIACLVGSAAFLYLTVYLGLVFYDSLAMGVRSMHVSQTPLFITQIIPIIGSTLMALQFLSMIGIKILNLTQGNMAGGGDLG